MGYTHYFYQVKELNQDNFNKVVSDFQKTLSTIEEKGVVLAGGLGKGVPEINLSYIRFNGKEECNHGDDNDCGGNCSHETFTLAQTYELDPWDKIKGEGGKYFNFCKTATKPYDLAVTICLIIAKHHLGDQVSIHSDGTLEEWKDAREVCQKVLGYGMDFDFDKEED